MSAEEAQVRKKRVRGGHKAHLTKMIGEIETLLSSTDPDRDDRLFAYKGCLERKADVITKLDSQILDEVDPDSIAEEIEAAEEIQTEIQMMIVKIDRKLAPTKVKQERSAGSGSSSTNAAGSERDITSQMRHMKLPKYEIKFDGDPKKYRAFRDSFDVAVMRYSALSDVERFTYLQSFLTGDAATAIEGLEITERNFKEALQILEERFGNKQVIVNSHIEQLVSITSVATSEDVREVRALHDKIEIHLRSLRTLGVDPESHGLLLVPLLKRKLPSDIILLLSRKFDSNVELWKISDMMMELKREIEARERSRTEDDCQKVSTKRPPKFPSTVEGLMAQNESKKAVICPYCEKKGHYPDQCRTITDPDKRKAILTEKKRCFLCTRANHIVPKCQAKRNCMKCKGKHHTSLCKGQREDNGDADAGAGAGAGGDNADVAVVAATVSSSSESLKKQQKAKLRNSVLLMTACTIISNPSNDSMAVWCRLILDDCAQRSYITKRLQNKLGLEVVTKESTSVGGFGGTSTGSKEFDVVLVAVKSEHSETIYVRCLVTDKICNPVHGQCIDLAKEQYEHLRGLQLADEGCGDAVEIEMLVGADNYWNIITGDHVVRGREGPVAVHSKLGYILSGPASSVALMAANERSISKVTNALLSIESEDDNLTSIVERFWNLETLGIHENGEELPGLNPQIVWKNGRYEVETPWKLDHGILGDNYVLALKRLERNLEKYRTENPDLLRKYSGIFKELLEGKLLEIVTEDMKPAVGNVYYMPHQLVIREDKETSKIRPVYDCSSKMKGVESLNDCLEVPEPLYADLFAVFIQFRVHEVGMIADIEKAFFQIGMAEKDRDLYRILFVDDPFKENPKLVVMRFTRVTFGVGPSMWHLGAVINHHLRKYEKTDSETVRKIDKGLYADDFSGGDADDKKAVELYRKTRKIFSDANMNMRKWRSNSEAVMNEVASDEQFSAEDRAKLMKPVKSLGVPWDTGKDTLIFSLKSAILRGEEDPMTKKGLLGASASLFDVIGFLAPVTFSLKVLFQKVCIEGTSWKELLSPELKQKWERWLAGAKQVEQFEMPRCYISEIMSCHDVALVGFCDASEKGYAAVIYLRGKFENDDRKEVRTNFVSSKTRVAPKEKQTIPRLELLGSLVLAMLMKKVKDILESTAPIHHVMCFTDSAVALHWIARVDRAYKKYVDTRVKKIRELVPIDVWKHVPGTENIADLPSRGCNPDEFAKQLDRWTYGPDWLKQDVSEWPVKTVDEVGLAEDAKLRFEKELKVDKSVKSTICVAKEERGIQNVIDPARYSSLEKLLRITGYCLKYVYKFVAKYGKGNNKKEQKLDTENDDDDELSAELLLKCKDLWIRHMQSEVRKDPNFKKMSQSLGIKEDEKGYLRCMGRLGRSKAPFETKHPLILPTSHWVTTLIIRECHEEVFHNREKETLVQLRTKYWVIRGRQKVKSVLKKCRLCKVMEGMSYPAPPTSELPQVRLEGGKAFMNTGVDFAGPLYVFDVYGAKDEMHKAYIALFTCAASRMIHLELVSSLETKAYIASQKRFMYRKRKPKMFISDNGKTFKSKLLKRFNAKRGIKWKFNLARAPWWGGLFERLVRSTKRCLRKAVGRSRLTFEELSTVLVEIEAILNSRPLTYTYEDDVETPVTPSHLFSGDRVLDTDDHVDLMSDDEEIAPLTKKQILKQTKDKENVIEHFWKRWYKEYLINLRETDKMRPQKKVKPVREGEVVLVEEDGAKRNKWRMGRIEKAIEGNDGVVRGASIKTKNGTVSRPLQKIYPLEVMDDEPELGDKIVSDVMRSTVPKIPTNLDNLNLQTPPASQLPLPTLGEGDAVEDDVEEDSVLKSYGTSDRPTRAAGSAGEERRRIVDSFGGKCCET